jgi:hypothetical protein
VQFSKSLAILLSLLIPTVGLAQSEPDQAIELLRNLAACPRDADVVDGTFKAKTGRQISRTVIKLRYVGDTKKYSMVEERYERDHNLALNSTFQRTLTSTETISYADIGSVEISPSGDSLIISCKKRSEGCDESFIVVTTFCDSETAQQAKRAIEILKVLSKLPPAASIKSPTEWPTEYRWWNQHQ